MKERMTLSERKAYNAGYRAGLKSLKEDYDGRSVWVADSNDELHGERSILTKDGLWLMGDVTSLDEIAFDVSAEEAAKMIGDGYTDVSVLDDGTVSFVYEDDWDDDLDDEDQDGQLLYKVEFDDDIKGDLWGLDEE